MTLEEQMQQELVRIDQLARILDFVASRTQVALSKPLPEADDHAD